MTITFDPTTGRSGSKRSPGSQPAGPSKAPLPLVADLGVLVAGLGLGATLGVTLTAETHSELVATGGLAMFAGNLTAMAGTYLALVMVLLVSRIPAIERAVGQDRLVRWHRRLSPWPLSLLAAHAVLTTIGYAEAAHSGIGKEIATFVGSFPDMLLALVGFGLMAIAAVTSIRAIRARLRRETWWTIHLVMYLGLALAFAHVIALGPSFVNHPLTRAIWTVAWLATAGVVIVYRIGLPVFKTLYHRLEVVEVRTEAPGVVSVICSGRHLERLTLAGGQFMLWRFLARGIWWQAHPYSVSALVRSPYIRLTVKQVGDHSAALGRLRLGTRVVIEGPYGSFTRHAQRHTKALLVAGGIGLTAVRSLLEDLPGGQRGAHPIVIVRVSRPEDFVFRAEISALVHHRRGQLHEIVGPRSDASLDEKVFGKLVPDIHQRDVFVCGPEGFVSQVKATLASMNVDPSTIHHEAFSL